MSKNLTDTTITCPIGCSKCVTFLSPQGGKLTQCNDDPSNSSGILIASIVVSLLVGMIILILVIIKCKKRKGNQQNENNKKNQKIACDNNNDDNIIIDDNHKNIKSKRKNNENDLFAVPKIKDSGSGVRLKSENLANSQEGTLQSSNFNNMIFANGNKHAKKNSGIFDKISFNSEINNGLKIKSSARKNDNDCLINDNILNSNKVSNESSQENTLNKIIRKRRGSNKFNFRTLKIGRKNIKGIPPRCDYSKKVDWLNLRTPENPSVDTSENKKIKISQSNKSLGINE
jgi:hypothetical protein